MCVHACVGGDSENESCRIRFGSETREEPTKRRVLQTAGRFITCCSVYLSPVSFNISPPSPSHPQKMLNRWKDKGEGGKKGEFMYNVRERETEIHLGEMIL